jgi:uncharacterized membrane protein
VRKLYLWAVTAVAFAAVAMVPHWMNHHHQLDWIDGILFGVIVATCLSLAGSVWERRRKA